MSPPRRPLYAIVPALAFFLMSAQAGAQTLNSAYQGLPAGEKVDWQKVTDERYGGSGSAETTTRGGGAPGGGAPGGGAPGGGGGTPGGPPAPSAPVTGALTTVWVEREGAKPVQNKVPITFGQVFAPGAVPRNTHLTGRLADGATVPLQVDIKATHPDGSLRHAVLSAVVPAPGAKPVALGLMREPRQASAQAATSPSALLNAGLSASVKASLGGRSYAASLEKLLAGAKPANWLAGPVAHEWHVSAPLSTASGEAHPHLTARFGVRWYPAMNQARVDVVVENNWAFQPSPQNFTYDAEVTVGGRTVYAKDDLEHYHHARWRKLFWWGGAPNVAVRHDPAYLMATRALPNYDRSVRVDESTLARMYAGWRGPKTEPMGVGQAVPYMPTTGGRPDIGLLPGWATMYLLEMDPRAREITFGTADLSGSWSMHYRDRNTGRPVSLLDYPYMTLVGTPPDARNPRTGKSELFPACARPGACDTPNRHDIPHQPNLTYLPYLLSGDHYYLEEMQFWAMYDVFNSNPGYRDHRKGLLKSEQVRGQAWAMRTLAETAYITPDNDPLKNDFLELLDNNLEWYNDTYNNNRDANNLGVIVNGYAVVYKDNTALAPWQDDFFTSAIGHVAELGFEKAEPLLAWKARFPVSRMVGNGSCWILGAMYTMTVRDGPNTPIYSNIAKVFQESREPELRQADCNGSMLAALLKLRVGEMTGYASAEGGYPSNMQPALAYAADALGEEGMRAWRRFMARSVKPDYGKGPQFAIVPRAAATTFVARSGY